MLASILVFMRIPYVNGLMRVKSLTYDLLQDKDFMM